VSSAIDGKYSISTATSPHHPAAAVSVSVSVSPTPRLVAVKRIRPFANDEWDARHTLREIRLMRLLDPHPNIIGLYDVSVHEAKTELYLGTYAVYCVLCAWTGCAMCLVCDVGYGMCAVGYLS